MKQLYISLLILLFGGSLRAQQDSVSLDMKRLQSDDIQLVRNDSLVQRIISATRLPIALSQSPYETYVITQAEIRRWNCNTLVDVLNFVPGLRTSKVGAALEGELFMADGLRGNSYFQFCINDVPVRPFGAKGMSIGAQLPIKQAERIEIIIGSMTALYGLEAGGGIINIILKDSNRPVITSSDLNFGSFRYNNIDVAFGTKVRVGKHTAQFNIHGGYTSWNKNANNTTIDSIDVNTYYPRALNNSYNYVQSAKNNNTTQTPHFSRYIGADLKYRAFFVYFRDMTRRDHSALGLNPSVTVYNDESTYLEDNINQIGGGFKYVGKAGSLNFLVDVINYNINPASSSLPMYNHLVRSFDYWLDKYAQADSLNPIVFEKEYLMVGQRYMIQKNKSLNTDFSFSKLWFKKLNTKFGASGMLSYSKATYSSYLRERFDQNLRNENPVAIDECLDFSMKLYQQTHFRHKNTDVFFNYAAELFTSFVINKNYKIGLSQKIEHKQNRWHLRANAAWNPTTPSPFYNNNRVIVGINQDIDSSYQVIYPYAKGTSNVKYLQKSINFQMGMDYFYKNNRLTANYNYHKIRNLYYFTVFEENQDSYSYTNVTNLVGQYLTGMQFNENYHKDLHRLTLVYDTKFSMRKGKFINATVHEQVSYTRNLGHEVSYLYDGRIRQVPKSILQFNLFIQNDNGFNVGITYRSMGSFLGSQATNNAGNKNSEGVKVLAPANAQMDIYASYDVNDYLSLSLKISNITQNGLNGIDASETIDDLRYNIQPGRTLLFGLKYNIEKMKRDE